MSDFAERWREVDRRWWEEFARHYQEICQIPIDILYGTGSPNEDELQLIGPVAGKRVLEAGCGGAQVSIAFAKQGALVTAIDVAASAIAFARELAAQHGVSIDFHQTSMEDLSAISSASQDIVFSANAYGYAYDQGAAFREIYRVLRDDGLFVLSGQHPFWNVLDDNGDSLEMTLSYFHTGRRIAGEGETDSPFPECRSTISEDFNALVEAGFHVERLVEPDSRRIYPYDPWVGRWGVTPKRLGFIPGTIIFKCRKLSPEKGLRSAHRE